MIVCDFSKDSSAGQSTPMHSYRDRVWRLIVSGGEVDVTTEGKPTPNTLRAWRARSLAAGPIDLFAKECRKTTFEIVDIELKSIRSNRGFVGTDPANLAAVSHPTRRRLNRLEHTLSLAQSQRP